MSDTSVEVLNWAHDAKKPEEMIIDGRTYTTRPVHKVVAPEASSIAVTTLTGLVDYINGGDGFSERKNIHIRVISPSEVVVESRIFGDFKQRETLIEANAVLPNISIIGTYCYQDTFITQLQACFEKKDGDFDKVAIYAKVVTKESTSTFTDDGTTQAVVFKDGFSSKDTASLPNPVTLYPRRTFAEIDQPETEMVFRMKDDGDGRPTFMLVESDGGAWRNKAILSIAEYLKKELPDVLVIA